MKKPKLLLAALVLLIAAASAAGSWLPTMPDEHAEGGAMLKLKQKGRS